jgi:hypothetical protein
MSGLVVFKRDPRLEEAAVEHLSLSRTTVVRTRLTDLRKKLAQRGIIIEPKAEPEVPGPKTESSADPEVLQLTPEIQSVLSVQDQDNDNDDNDDNRSLVLSVAPTSSSSFGAIAAYRRSAAVRTSPSPMSLTTPFSFQDSIRKLTTQRSILQTLRQDTDFQEDTIVAFVTDMNLDMNELKHQAIKYRAWHERRCKKEKEVLDTGVIGTSTASLWDARRQERESTLALLGGFFTTK